MDITYKSPEKMSFWAWVLVLAVPVLLWVLYKHPLISPPKSVPHYIFHFSWWVQIKFWIALTGLYLLPGLLQFYWAGRRWEYNPFLSGHRLLLALAWGMSAHVLALLIQKFFHLSYVPGVVLGCLGVSYAILGILCRPFRDALKESKPAPRKLDPLALTLLLLALFLGLELIFRARTSSANLVGDTMIHFLLMLGTLQAGPLPDGIPVYSTFILNLQPMAFHGLLAGLKTLQPSLDYVDLFRYFSSTFYPFVLGVFYVFFSYLAKNRSLGALCTLILLWVSGGGLSTAVPMIVYPYYWTLAWCLTAILFYLILKFGFDSAKPYLALGFLYGVGSLFHAYFAIRVGTVLVGFLILEWLRRWVLKEKWGPLLKCGGAFVLGLLLPLALWLGPLLVKYSWEPTYSFGYILKNFKEVAPEGVAYIQNLKNQHYGWTDLLPWTWKNVGIFPVILLPLTLWGWYRRRREPAAMLLAAWVLMMAGAVHWGFLPNPYRYFEYFFLGLLALTAFGWGAIYSAVREKFRPLILAPLLILALLSVYHDFYPKHHLALRLYGRTHWSAQVLEPSRKRARWFLQAKQQGELDSQMGWFKGYLWGRQKKVWDLYVAAQKKPKKK